MSGGDKVDENDANKNDDEDKRKEEIKKQLMDDEEEDRKLLDSIPDESVLCLFIKLIIITQVIHGF